MSHQDAVTNLPKGFNKIASTKNSALTIIENKNSIGDLINKTNTIAEIILSEND